MKRFFPYATIIIIATIGSMRAVESDVRAVEVEASTPDTVGSAIVFRLKEQIRKSSGYRLTTATEAKCRVIIRSLEVQKNVTSYSVVFALQPPGDKMPFYLSSAMGVCSAENVGTAADRILSTLDSDIDVFMRSAKP